MADDNRRWGWYEPGEKLADRFEVKSLLGTGGMGNVYLAQHVILQRKFAVKVLAGDTPSEQAVARFRKEARAASRVHHRNVTAVVDFGHTDEGCPYLVMEYAEGPTLAETLETSGRLPLRRALHVLRQIADALCAAHTSGVIHRDLKAQNIVLTSDYGQQDVVKVLDFGLAEILKENPTGAPDGKVAGTPSYMAPEQCRGEPTDQRTDIYAFGILAYEVLVGRPPFAGTVIEQIAAHIQVAPSTVSEASSRKDITPELDALVARCLAKDPEYRYPAAAMLSQHLRVMQRAAALAQVEPAAESPAASYEDLRARTGISGPWEVTSPGSSRDWATPEWSDVTGWTRTEAEWSRSGLEHTEARYLEDLAFAVRDHGLGSPEISYALAAKLRVEDDAYRILGDIHLLEAHLEGLEATGRERELRLRQALSQLEHERAVARKGTGAPELQGHSMQLDRAIGEIADHIDSIQQRVLRQRKQLTRQLARLQRRLAAIETRVAVQQGTLAKILKQVGASALQQAADSPPVDLLEKLAARAVGLDVVHDGTTAEDARALEQALHVMGLGAEPAPARRLRNAREARKVDSSTTLIRLSGTIDERADLAKLNAEIPAGATNVVIDTSEVQRLSSAGVREWIAWVKALKAKGHRCYFLECSPAIMATVCEVESLLADGQIVSFWAPYFCPSCETDHVLLIGLDKAKSASFEVPVCYCERCDHALMEFDDIESSYFAFLEHCPPLPADAALQATLQQLSRSPVGTLFPTAKLAARDMVSGELEQRRGEQPAERSDAPQPPRRKARLKVAIEQHKETVALVTIAGVIDEYNDLGNIGAQLPGETRSVLINTANVQRINSSGVRDWIALLGDLDAKGYPYYFIDCAPALMTQVSLVQGLLGKGEILTFFAPYFCASCETDKMLRISAEQALAGDAFSAPACRCDECLNPMEFDDIESTYFAFLKGKLPPLLGNALAETLKTLCPPSAEELHPLPTIDPSAAASQPLSTTDQRPAPPSREPAAKKPESAEVKPEQAPRREPEQHVPPAPRAPSAPLPKLLLAVFALFIAALALLIYVMSR